MTYVIPSLMERESNLEIVGEANVTERTPHLPVIKIPFEISVQDAVVSTQINGYDIHECWKQKCGLVHGGPAGIYYLYWALTVAKPSVVPGPDIESFHISQIGSSVAGRSCL